MAAMAMQEQRESGCGLREMGESAVAMELQCAVSLESHR